jgi:hypothetical protein
MHKGFTRRCAVLVAASALLVGAAPTIAAPHRDIVGIRLGMTPAQARAALQAYAPKAEVTEYSRQFSYHDGVRDQPLPGFLASITARQGSAPAHAETVQVMFSAPPMEQRVIRVIRTLALHDDPLALERATASVTQKYGRPSAVLAPHLNNGSISRWVEAGKPVCGDTAPTSHDARQAPPVDHTPGGLSHYDAWHRRKLAPADASNCAAALVVSLVTRNAQDPLVREMTFVMTDPGYAVPAMRATAQQIADLQAQARKARQTSGAVPKL